VPITSACDSAVREYAQQHYRGRETAKFRQERATGGGLQKLRPKIPRPVSASSRHWLPVLVPMAQSDMRQLGAITPSELRLIVRCFDRAAVHKHHIPPGKAKH